MSQSLAEEYAEVKRRIIGSLFTRTDEEGTLLEKHITHVRVYEDEVVSPGGGDGRKQRYIILSVKKNGRVQVLKARENTNGSFSVGKQWHLDDLASIHQTGPTSISVELGKPYFWSMHTQLERRNFVRTLIRVYQKYTNGKLPELVGIEEPPTTPATPSARPSPFTPVRQLEYEAGPANETDAHSLRSHRSALSNASERSLGRAIDFSKPLRTTSQPTTFRHDGGEASHQRSISGSSLKRSLPGGSLRVGSRPGSQQSQDSGSTAFRSPYLNGDTLSPKPSISRFDDATPAPYESEHARLMESIERSFEPPPHEEVPAITPPLATQPQATQPQATTTKTEPPPNLDQVFAAMSFDAPQGHDMVEGLSRELRRLELLDIQFMVSSSGGVHNLGTSLDAAIAQCDDLDNALTLYAVELNSIAPDVAHVEGQGKGLQVQATNQNRLVRYLQDMLGDYR